MLRRHQVPLPETTDDDLRVGHLLGRRVSAEKPARVCLLGFPSDEGVGRNGGRVGAAEAPAAIRRALYRLTPDARNVNASRALLERSVDLGDVEISGDLERDQQDLAEALRSRLSDGAVVVVLGGGHETTFGHFLGYVQSALAVAILNWDAHADVRPLLNGKGHSGSPFRQALEHPSGACLNYTVAGLLAHAVAAAHLEFLRDQGADPVWRSALDHARVDAIYQAHHQPTLVTFDLDAVDQAHAPGVSAPATGGLDPTLWLYAARQAGRTPTVQSIDVVELNPRFDRDDQTARLAALTVWEFLAGLAERETGVLGS